MATHYVARELSALGHDVRQVPPAYAKPFRQGHKNDFRDAHAIAEVRSRATTSASAPSCNLATAPQNSHRKAKVSRGESRNASLMITPCAAVSANCQGEPFSHVDTPSDVKASIVGRLIQPSPSAATELMHRATIRLSLPRASASLRACLCLTAENEQLSWDGCEHRCCSRRRRATCCATSPPATMTWKGC
jgi:hypothetical protein